MKIYPVATALILSLAAPLVLAQQEPQQPPAAMPDQPAQAQPPGDASPLLSLMQQRLEEMHAFMEKLNQTTDPAERQKLVSEALRVHRVVETHHMRQHDAGGVAVRHAGGAAEHMADAVAGAFLDAGAAADDRHP